MADDPQILIDRFLALAGAETETETSRAVRLVKKYFGTLDESRTGYLGARFETFAGGGLQEPNVLTLEDLLSVELLSVSIPVHAKLAILGELSADISACLEELPSDLAFENLSGEQFHALLGDDNSPASRLWKLLRGQSRVGQTKTSKLMARKRPALVPIYDSVVREQAGLAHQSRDHWIVWREAFSGNREFTTAIANVRAESGQSQLSLLRTLDIVLWMDATTKK
ncbi:DUF6308 family protein [Zhihengliuella salsuginis]|uniref:Uncharacterized protein n=1 Tax=Zhihengliuella salsuginis TaxID=578222 RepID=A0ABQ3GJ18_9MICC|nr:DUF6308 family protein [Zhihengliuella salsuginis]GHD06235.1 hypothetical protein GCM10008096_15980 [Zhihengliuella salsuginis]